VNANLTCAVAGFLDNSGDVIRNECTDAKSAAESFYKIRNFTLWFPQNSDLYGCPVQCAYLHYSVSLQVSIS
jgi:hypothetical protein